MATKRMRSRVGPKIGIASRRARRPRHLAGDQQPGQVTMMPLFFAAVFSTAISLGFVGTAGSASPMQTAGAAPESWGGFDLLLVLDQEEFTAGWKQLNAQQKLKRGGYIDDDILHIEGGYDASEGQGPTRYGDHQAAVHHRTNEWLKTP